MSAVYSFKIRGLTTGGSTIATTGTITIGSDGIMRWTSALDGLPKSLQIANGCGGDLGSLIDEIFTGASGFDAGGTDEQGHRTFGEPRLKQ